MNIDVKNSLDNVITVCKSIETKVIYDKPLLDIFANDVYNFICNISIDNGNERYAFFDKLYLKSKGYATKHCDSDIPKLLIYFCKLDNELSGKINTKLSSVLVSFFMTLGKSYALNEINSYFKRGDQRGTDVVIIAPNIYSDEHFVQLSIINAVLESFFVAIIEKKLVVEITGFTGKKAVVINHKTFEEVLEQYYQDPKGIVKETDTLIIGNLYNYYEAFCVEPEIIKIKDDAGKEIGSVELYFILENSKKKKYYSMIRSHGMKICDHYIYADQPFTAIAYIKGEELNEYLSKLENAAHDNFVTRDAHSDKDSVKVYKRLKKLLKIGLLN